MRPTLLLVLPGTILLAAAPAVAASSCHAIIAELQAVLEQAELAPRQEDATIETEDGAVVVTTPDGGVEPQENWFGSPASTEGADERLRSARAMADDGQEEECLVQVREVEAILRPSDG